MEAGVRRVDFQNWVLRLEFSRGGIVVPFAILAICGLCGMSSADEVGPLLTTSWGQSGVGGENALCPSFSFDVNNPGKKEQAPAGCVAIALAQIMNYWGQWTGMPGHGYGMHNDVFAYGGGTQGVELPGL